MKELATGAALREELEAKEKKKREKRKEREEKGTKAKATLAREGGAGEAQATEAKKASKKTTAGKVAKKFIGALKKTALKTDADKPGSAVKTVRKIALKTK